MTNDLVKLLEQLFDECGLNEDLGFLEDYDACVAVFAEKISKHYAARISALEAALKPFADESKKFDTLDLSVFTHDEVELWQPGGNRRTHLTVGDLRRAKAALEGDQRSKALDELAKIDAEII